jgi:hypothetical protein
MHLQHLHGRMHVPAEDADQVIGLAPNVMDGYHHKGFALFNMRKFDEAVSFLLPSKISVFGELDPL